MFLNTSLHNYFTLNLFQPELLRNPCTFSSEFKLNICGVVNPCKLDAYYPLIPRLWVFSSIKLNPSQRILSEAEIKPSISHLHTKQAVWHKRQYIGDAIHLSITHHLFLDSIFTLWHHSELSYERGALLLSSWWCSHFIYTSIVDESSFIIII